MSFSIPADPTSTPELYDDQGDMINKIGALINHEHADLNYVLKREGVKYCVLEFIIKDAYDMDKSCEIDEMLREIFPEKVFTIFDKQTDVEL